MWIPRSRLRRRDTLYAVYSLVMAMTACCAVAAQAETYSPRCAGHSSPPVLRDGTQVSHASGAISLDFAVNQTIAGSRLFTRTCDPESAFTRIRFWDSTPGAGHLTLDAGKITGSYVEVTPDEVGRVTYFTGPRAGTNDIVIEATDDQGRLIENLRVRIRVRGRRNQPPVIRGSGYVFLDTHQQVPASRLFTSASDPDGSINHYTFFDATPGAGHFTLDGARITGDSLTIGKDGLTRVAYVTDAKVGQNTVAMKAFDDRGQGSKALVVVITVTNPSASPTKDSAAIIRLGPGNLGQTVQAGHAPTTDPGVNPLDTGAVASKDGGVNQEIATHPSRSRIGGDRKAVETVGSESGVSANSLTPGRRVAAAEPFTEVLLEAEVNRQKTGEVAVFLRDAQGNIYASEAELRRWRVTLPDSPAVNWKGVAYRSLNEIRGIAYRVDTARQAIEIDFPAGVIGTTVIDESKGVRKMPPRPGLGGFLNYSLFGERLGGATTTSAEFEAGVFGRLGLFTTGYLARKSDLPSAPSVRLETTWTYDDPANITTLRLGDGINRSGPWGNSVRFGGVQYGTNFATQPNLITSPGQTFMGQAAVPSTVDVFVNNALISSARVPPGPFSITNIPVVTGTGEVQVVVRDAFGREQVVTQPFYATPTLLRAGFSDYAIEGGVQRNEYGLASNDYGSWLASGTYRYGITNRLTGALRGEANRDIFNVGVSADYLVGDFATLSGTIAGGPNNAGGGALFGVGVSRQARMLSFNARSEYTTPDFRQLGLADGQLPRERLTTISASYNFGAKGSIAAAAVGQYYRDQPDIEVGSLSYNVTLPGIGFLSFVLLRTLGITNQTQFFATFTIPFGRDYTATIATNRARSDNGSWVADNSFTFQKNLPAGDGYGYLLRATNNSQRLASLALQNAFGTYSAEVASQKGTTGERISAAGGIGWVGDRPFFSRLIQDGFALIRVGFPNVRVYANNQPIGRTDAYGDLIIPRLLAYQKNLITVEQLDLPLDVEIGKLELDATPYFRSGTVVEFPIRRVRNALLQIVLEDGGPLPAGAMVRVAEQKETFPVGLGGIAYVTGLAAANRIVVEWRGKSCALEFPLPDTAEPQARIGPLVCKGVKR